MPLLADTKHDDQLYFLRLVTIQLQIFFIEMNFRQHIANVVEIPIHFQ
jgi:hypothetical protein